MGINVKQLRELVIKPILKDMPSIHYSDVAVEMLLMIAAHESKMGYFIRQVGVNDGVGAYGIFQIETATIDDCYRNYLDHRPSLGNHVLSFSGRTGTTADIIANIPYQVALARVILYRAPERLPESGDLNGMAKYCKKYWNTELGKATAQDYLCAYNKYC